MARAWKSSSANVGTTSSQVYLKQLDLFSTAFSAPNFALVNPRNTGDFAAQLKEPQQG
jgi:hypothetical protein